MPRNSANSTTTQPPEKGAECDARKPSFVGSRAPPPPPSVRLLFEALFFLFRGTGCSSGSRRVSETSLAPRCAGHLECPRRKRHRQTVWREENVRGNGKKAQVLPKKTVEDASPVQCSCGALSTAAGDVPSCEGHEEGHRWRHRLDEHPHVARRDTDAFWRSQISRGRDPRFDANQGLMNPKKQPLHRRHVHEGVCFRRVMVDTPDVARDVRRGLVCSRRVDTISAEAPEPERHPPRQCR